MFTYACPQAISTIISFYYNYAVNRIHRYYVIDKTSGITVIIYTYMCQLHNYVDNYKTEGLGYIISTHAVALVIKLSV